MSLFGTLASLSTPSSSLGGNRLASGGASGASGRLDDPSLSDPSVDAGTGGVVGTGGESFTFDGIDVSPISCQIGGRLVIGIWG